MSQTSFTTSHLALLAGATFFAGAADAANLVVNPSFEQGTAGVNNPTDVTGWTGVGKLYNHPYNGLSGTNLAGAAGAQSLAATGNFDFNSLLYGYAGTIDLDIGSKFHGLGGGSQTIGEAALTAVIPAVDLDAGGAAFCFSSWLSSYKSDGNMPALRLRFFSADAGGGSLLGTFTLDRGTTANQVETANHLATGDYLSGTEDSRTDPDYWALYEIKAAVPPGTRSATIDFVNGTGHVASGSNDWYADAIVFEVVPVPALRWTGASSGEWSTGTIAAPKNWQLVSSPATSVDFTGSAPVNFGDSATTGNVVLSNGDVAPGSILLDNPTRPYHFSGTGSISGVTSFTKTGAAALTFANTNTFSGLADLAEGNITLENSLALQNATVATYFGQSQILFGAPAAYTLGGLSGDADLTLANATAQPVALTVGPNGQSTTYNGIISGAGSLTKSGNGTLTLPMASTFAGGTTLAGGRIAMASPEALGSGPIVSTGGTLGFNFGNGSNITLPNNITLPANAVTMFTTLGAPSTATTVQLDGKLSGGNPAVAYRFVDTGIAGNHNNVVVLTNPDNDFQGTIELWRGTLGFTSDAALGHPDNDINQFTEVAAGSLRFDADNITLNPGRNIQFYTSTGATPINTQDFTGTIEGNFGGVGDFIKQGNGTLIVTGGNNATGLTTISAGTLRVDGSFAAAANPVTVQAAGTLAGTGFIARNIALSGTLAPGNGVGQLDSTGVLTIAPGAKLAVEIGNWTGAVGTGYDTTTTDSLAITATAATPATVIVTPATLANFVDEDRSFTIASGVNAATGFDPAAFVVDASAMPASTRSWFVSLSGNNLVLVHGTPAASPFAAWASSKSLTGADAAFDADPDHDGIPNGIEFVIGGEPSASSSALLPTLALVNADPDGDLTFSNYLLFTFRRSDSAAELNPVCQYNTGLTGSWTDADGGVNGIFVAETNNGFGTGIDEVKVYLPRSLSAGGKLFVRLAVAE